MPNLMDDVERRLWNLYHGKDLKYDKWTWINGIELGNTFQSHNIDQIGANKIESMYCTMRYFY